MYTRFQDSDNEDDLIGPIKLKPSKDDPVFLNDNEVGDFVPPPIESEINEN